MGARPRILFVHDHFPGQFGGWADWLAARGWEVTAATRHPPAIPPRFRVVTYAPHRAAHPGTHPYAQPMEVAVLTAQGFARTGLALRREGYRPDVIVAHSGWGAGLFAKDVFPEARLIAYAEWWYRHPGADIAFLATQGPGLGGIDPSSVPLPDAPMIERARNAPIALDLTTADLALCPTAFQAAQFPDPIRGRLVLCHDGIDTGDFRPGPVADPTLGGRVPAGAPLITYATRGMEPHRGFPAFMAALPKVLARHPETVAVIAGSNAVSYGGRGIREIDWKAKALAELDLPPGRVIFTGPLAPDSYRMLLRRSAAHVYLTAPFVLSWSMLEAMATAAPCVLSDTPPVREFAGPREAFLTPIEPAAIAAAISAALVPDAGRARGAAARQAIRAGPGFARAMAAKDRILAGLGFVPGAGSAVRAGDQALRS